MTTFRIAVQIVPRRGILDPQGKAVADALHSLGFDRLRDAHIGRYVLLDLEAPDEASATADARRMCEQLLANPVTEDYHIASVDHP